MPAELGHCFSMPWFRLCCQEQRKGLVMLWCPFTQVSWKSFSAGAFINSRYFAFDLPCYTSPCLPVSHHITYTVASVCFPSTCDVSRLWTRAPSLAVTLSLLLSSQRFTHSCLFLSPNLQILCTQVDLLFWSSKLSFMRMCSGACWAWSLFSSYLSLTLPHCKLYGQITLMRSVKTSKWTVFWFLRNIAAETLYLHINFFAIYHY